MEHYWVIARSVTYAQRMQAALGRCGVRCRMFRAPRELVELGCAYALEIPETEIRRAMECFHREQLRPVGVYLTDRGTFREVAL